MQFHIMRGPKQQIRGIAVTWNKATILPVLPGGRIPQQPVPRFCDMCLGDNPILFCHSHCKYVCESCIRFHNQPQACKYLSLSAMGQLIRKGA